MTLENASINVALCIRADAESNPGGDWLQLQKTANTLQALGVNTQICVGRVPEQPVDLVHAFNLTRLSNTHMVAQWCQQNDVPLAISPIWHSLADMGLFYAEHFRRWPGQCFPMPAYLALKELLYERGHWNRYVWTAALRWRMTQKKTVQQAAVLLPNSPKEGQTLEQELAVNAKVTHVIPNAVDLGHCYAEQSPKEKLIVCPGRLEPRKNQQRVVEAFLASKALQEYDLLLLGALNQRHAAYQDRFLTLVNTHDRLRWVDHVSFEEAQRIYARSALVVLASHFETTGLVGLEGLYQGTPVVMTERCYTDYYYGDRVTYCDPYQVASIQQAMEQAIERPFQRPDSNYFEHFSWDNVGRRTLSAYQQVLHS